MLEENRNSTLRNRTVSDDKNFVCKYHDVFLLLFDFVTFYIDITFYVKKCKGKIADIFHP